jgi:hypothetical protein
MFFESGPVRRNARRPCFFGVLCMVLIQLLLPSVGHDGAALDAAFALTRTELVEQFGGLTAYLRAPAHGAWVNPQGHVERDEVVMVEVVTKDFDRAWWRRYVTTLEARFSQTEIHVRALAIEVP